MNQRMKTEKGQREYMVRSRVMGNHSPDFNMQMKNEAYLWGGRRKTWQA